MAECTSAKTRRLKWHIGDEEAMEEGVDPGDAGDPAVEAVFGDAEPVGECDLDSL